MRITIKATLVPSHNEFTCIDYRIYCIDFDDDSINTDSKSMQFYKICE